MKCLIQTLSKKTLTAENHRVKTQRAAKILFQRVTSAALCVYLCVLCV